mmetsp:Transcript_1027/g.1353  ORF Transcript_1027/g.1353 Transcript_1027/m.1353 type:complete len:221 (-) Transcript_1027:51-713(-)
MHCYSSYPHCQRHVLNLLLFSFFADFLDGSTGSQPLSRGLRFRGHGRLSKFLLFGVESVSLGIVFGALHGFDDSFSSLLSGLLCNLGNHRLVRFRDVFGLVDFVGDLGSCTFHGMGAVRVNVGLVKMLLFQGSHLFFLFLPQSFQPLVESFLLLLIGSCVTNGTVLLLPSRKFGSTGVLVCLTEGSVLLSPLRKPSSVSLLVLPPEVFHFFGRMRVPLLP